MSKRTFGLLVGVWAVCCTGYIAFLVSQKVYENDLLHHHFLINGERWAALSDQKPSTQDGLVEIWTDAYGRYGYERLPDGRELTAFTPFSWTTFLGIGEEVQARITPDDRMVNMVKVYRTAYFPSFHRELAGSYSCEWEDAVKCMQENPFLKEEFWEGVMYRGNSPSPLRDGLWIGLSMGRGYFRDGKAHQGSSQTPILPRS